MKQATNKAVVITGGNSGIGKGIAKKFAQEGARVVIFGRNQETLESTKKELFNDALAIQGDVSNTEDLRNLFTITESHFGKIAAVVKLAQNLAFDLADKNIRCFLYHWSGLNY